jgi:hypothetical protein
VRHARANTLDKYFKSVNEAKTSEAGASPAQPPPPPPQHKVGGRAGPLEVD